MSTGGRRAAAVLVAVVLVGGAVVVRNATSGGGSEPSEPDRPLRLLCAAELADACDAIGRDSGVEIVSEPAGTSANRLANVADSDRNALDVDGWLTPAPQPTIVDQARARAGQLDPLFDTPSAPLARSPLVLVEWKNRGDVLAAHCGGQVSWSCIGNVAEPGQWDGIGGDVAWGPVKVTHADPATSGVGLLVVGQEARSYIGRADLSRDDFDDPAFQEWFSRLEQAAAGRAQADPVASMLQLGPSAVDVVGTSEADACRKLAAAARGSELRVVVPKPVASAEVVYAPVANRDRGKQLGDIVTGDTGRRALAAAGWRVPGEPTAGGQCAKTALAKGSNEPDAGALVALLEVRGNG